MPTQEAMCSTPRYLLHEDRQPISPNIVQDSQGHNLLAVYGFSAKATYDRFIKNSDGDLRPYPMMKGYLRNRIDEEPSGTYVVVIDAQGPVAQSVDAATMENVLAAQDSAAEHLPRDFCLALCLSGDAYSVTEEV